MYLTKEHEMVKKSVIDFVKKEINPYVDEWEENEISPLHDIFKKMGDLGFLGIRYDTKYGGEGLDYWHELALLEGLCEIESSGVMMAICVQCNMATPAITKLTPIIPPIILKKTRNTLPIPCINCPKPFLSLLYLLFSSVILWSPEALFPRSYSFLMDFSMLLTLIGSPLRILL